MKRIAYHCIAFLAGLSAILVACNQSGPRMVDYPFINFANTTSIDIVKVDLNDSSTVLTIDANYLPNYWIRIAPETKLVANGVDYNLTGADGIVPGEEFYMPESGKAQFTLSFEPLPYSTSSFDFIEGNEERSFHLWGVDISGKHFPEYPVGLPKEMQRKIADEPLPTPVFAIDSTLINIQMLPVSEQLLKGNSLYVNTFFYGQKEIPVKFDSNGKAHVSIELYSICECILVNTESRQPLASFHCNPGETIDLYIDSRITGQWTMRNRPDFESVKIGHSYHNGIYGNVDRVVDISNDINRYQLRSISTQFDDYHITRDQFMNILRENLNLFQDSIDMNKTSSNLIKEIQKLNLQNSYLDVAANYKRYVQYFYHQNHGWNNYISPDSISIELTDDDYKEIVGWFDNYDAKLLYVGVGICGKDWGEYGAGTELPKSLNKLREAKWMIDQRKFKPEFIDSLKTLPDPFFATAADSIYQRAERKYIELLKKTSITPTPNVPVKKIFDAIIAPHKGKVVLVDLWNTWCGPCRAALAANEPLKSTTFSNDDIVWIYIADDSSTMSNYLEIISEIKGEHYMLTQEQIEAIRNRFNVDGIPYYILVDQQGNAEGRPDLRNHNKMVNEIKSKL